MQQFNCIIIEDQLPAQRVLIDYIEQVPNLNLLDVFLDPLEAISILEKNKIDIIFLDIHLPKISGIDFLKTLKHRPNIILTTAFSKYALQGYELDVVDYLLKPFSFERFLKAISKINRLTTQTAPIVHRQFLFIRTKGSIQKVRIEDILFVEASGDFVLIYTKEGRLTANATLQEIQTRLGNNFTRCHKSFVINLNAINKIVGNRIQVDKHQISIGRTYRSDLMGRLKTI